MGAQRIESRGRDGKRAGAPERTYSVGEFSSLTGVTVRTLYHYESLGLLHPRRLPNGYRQYGCADVDRMQQILILRELGMGLSDIARNLDVPPAQRRQTLRHHLEQLKRQRDRLDRIIASVEATLTELDGGNTMSADEKFEAFKQELVDANEREYGQEVRGRWGDEAVDASSQRLMGLSRADFERAQKLEGDVRSEVLAGLADGDADGSHGAAAASAHAAWLRLFWPEGAFSPQAHAGLAQMYLADDRFRAYYDALAPGATEFLVRAIEHSAGH